VVSSIPPPLLPHPFSFCNASLLCALSSVPKDEKLETNWYCHNVRNLENHAPLLCAVYDLQFLLPSNQRCLRPSIPTAIKRENLENHAPMLRAACDLQFLLPLTENTSKTMHQCSALSATFNSSCHQTREPRKPCTNAPRCLRPSIPTAIN